MDETEFKKSKLDWIEDLRRIALEVRTAISAEILGDKLDEELSEIESKIEEAANDLEAIVR